MTPAEKIAELRSRTRYDHDWRDIDALLDIAEAAVAVAASGHRDEGLPCAHYWNRPCDCGRDNLAAKLAALGGG